MTKKKPKALKVMRVPCIGLNRIIEIKKLTDKQINDVYSKLKAYISTPTLSDDTRIITDYIKLVLVLVLTDDEHKRVDTFSLTATKKDNITLYAEMYKVIVDNYPVFRIDYVCSDLNGWMPGSLADMMLSNMQLIPEDPKASATDAEFKKHVKKQSEKKEKKVDKYNFSTLKSINELKDFLTLNVIGQDEAIETICNALKLKSVGFSNTVTLFFIGPTGVGKSQVSKLLGEKYSGNFYQVNCSDYSNGHEMNKLIGSPPGYIGHSDKSPLSEKADKSNRWVFLLDEIEKAHDKFFNWLLPLIETGKTYDNCGRLLDFSESIFIFTSNCGVKDIKESSISFSGKSHSTNSTKEELTKSIKKEFSPEFRNRVDEFVFFNPITRSNAEKIVELHLAKFPIKRTPELIKYVCDNGFSEEYGARELIRFIKKNIAIPLADTILESKLPNDDTYSYDCTINQGKVCIINTVP